MKTQPPTQINRDGFGNYADTGHGDVRGFFIAQLKKGSRMGTRKMSPKAMLRALRDAKAGSAVDEVKQRVADANHVVKVNGKFRIEGYITLLMSQYELLKSANPSLPPVMPLHCFAPRTISGLFGVPLAELGVSEETPSGEESQSNFQQRMTVALERLADHLAPKPPDIVGTPYLAQKLDCSKQWITEMIRTGDLPADAIVVGTGNGKPWKFHRHLIDKWIKNR